jgi:hypothetical protein
VDKILALKVSEGVAIPAIALIMISGARIIHFADIVETVRVEVQSIRQNAKVAESQNVNQRLYLEQVGKVSLAVFFRQHESGIVSLWR